MDTPAVVLEAPETLKVRRLELVELTETDLLVEVDFSGISTGTERLLWSGRMPPFPGMGYPLVPGYESVGRVSEAGALAKARVGECVFVPGSSGFRDARGLFGGAAKRLVVPSARAPRVPDALGPTAVLIALAATARHALADAAPPDLVVGHGVLGRLLARAAIALGAPPPMVWERAEARRSGGLGYPVLTAEEDPRADYGAVYDVTGEADLVPTLIERLRRQGELVLAGFYEKPIAFPFPPAFMREARLRVAAEWRPEDLTSTLALLEAGRLSLDGLITHQRPAADAESAYRTAFSDPSCLKMVLDWRSLR